MAATIFSRFLGALGVPHTDTFSDAAFRGMTFRSLFGLSHLLKDYGVPNIGVRFNDKKALAGLTAPFLAQLQSGAFVIVTALDSHNGSITYDSLGQTATIGREDFANAWNGVALLAFPEAAAREPHYLSHKITETVTRLSRWALLLDGLAVIAYFVVTRHIYAHISTALLALFNYAGLYLAYMLLQKTLNIHTAVSDRVCGVLEKGGCDSILNLKVSKLFGVFAWSEIGFSYFAVSFATLLLFPHMWPALALFNVLCLPYTCWSIWYQKFRARHWCTLCVGVQTTLWLLFICYLCGGWLALAFPPRADFLALAAVYLLCVLGLNMTLRLLRNLPDHENDPQA